MSLKSQDSMTTATLFTGTTFSLWCRCFGKPFDIMTLGNFPVNNWVSQKMWEFRMRHAIKIFMPVQTRYWSHSAPVHFAPWRTSVCQKHAGILFLPLWRYHTKGHMSVNNQAISSWSLLFFRVATVLRENVRNIIANSVKDGCGTRVKEAREKQNTEHRRHSVAPFCIPTSAEPDIYWHAWKANNLMLTFLLPVRSSFG